MAEKGWRRGTSGGAVVEVPEDGLAQGLVQNKEGY